MNRTQAISRLKKLLGPKLAYRENPSALVGDEREAAISERRRLHAITKAAGDALDARRAAVLAADAEYQALKTAHAAARKAEEAAGHLAFSHRVTVGTASELFFTVRAEGDNWQDVVDQLTKKEAE